MIEFKSTIEKFDFNHWQHHVRVPNEYLDQLMDDKHRRVLVHFDEHGPIHLAILKSKEYWYLLINQQIRNKLKVGPGDELVIKIERDHSEFGHEVPEEFSVMLDQEPEAKEYFDKLTPGKQRSLIYIVSKVKNPESRMKKALAITHHMKESQGNLDFKRLNELIKFYNNL